MPALESFVMSTTPYTAKLKDPRWQKKRLDILNLANWRCEDCRRGDRQLEVHHCAYVPRTEPWEYDAALLMCLCGECHEFRQQREDSLRVNLGRVTRFLTPSELEGEAWQLVQEMATRQTKRLAESFS